MESQRRKESKRDVLCTLKYKNSLEISCSFLVHLPNSRVFTANNIFEIQHFMPSQKSWGLAKGPGKFLGAVAPPQRTATVSSLHKIRILKPIETFQEFKVYAVTDT